MNGWIQRHFDYVLGPNQDANLASVPAGRTIELQLKVRADAPFVLRSRALRVQPDATTKAQAGLNHVTARFAGPDMLFRSENFIRQTLLSPYAGQIGNPFPVYPEIYYPPNSHFRVDIINDGTSAITNLYLYFRGFELYREGAVKSFDYPKKFGVLPFSRLETVSSVTVSAGQTSQPAIRKTFTIQTDADFVCRSGQSGFLANQDASGNPVVEVFVKLKDIDEKPYSNDFVHADILFGNSGQQQTFPAGSSSGVSPVQGGPNSPGIFFPEIYMPKNTTWYIDVARNDSSFAGAATIDYPIALSGCKVFEK
jgi:hypothetical protein